jgi:Restriction endonuclease
VRSNAPSPLRGVSTEEVLDALGAVFSPTELDWELVGVSFVNADSMSTGPAQPTVGVMVEEPPWAAEAQSTPTDPPPTARKPRTADQVVARTKGRTWLREHDEIMSAVRELSWEGYRSLITDIFRRDGYEVFGGEGPDGDVIDMEVVRGAERMLVNCQLRGLSEIGVEPLSEMEQVVERNGADGVFMVSDGDFTPDAWSLADGQALVLIDQEALLGLVLDLTLGPDRDRSLRGHMRRLLSRSGE